jgi:hypothetical protein
MAQDPFSPIFCIDVSADPSSAANKIKVDPAEMMLSLLQRMIAGQERQTKLLEEIAHHVGLNHKQRQSELAQWKDANPGLAKNCRVAAEMLAKVQTDFLQTITEEVYHGGESLAESEYMLTDFCDKFGPRLAHLNGVLQVLSQLSANPQQQTAAQE